MKESQEKFYLSYAIKGDRKIVLAVTLSVTMLFCSHAFLQMGQGKWSELVLNTGQSRKKTC